MQSLTSEQLQSIETKTLDHLGLVAAVIKEAKLEESINQLLPLSLDKGAILTNGQRVKAMILNALGYVNDRLYMFEAFMENKPVERLFGPGITAEHFNDDALGRALDAIHDYGPELFFAQLALPIAQQYQLLTKTLNTDSTSLVLFGQYEQSQEDTLNPAYGYSKDHRTDLKQVMLSLTTTGESGFPLWLAPQDGNASDQKILYEQVQKIHQRFTQAWSQAPDFLHVADSAMYESCLAGTQKGAPLRWVSRVPMRSNDAKAFKEQTVKEKDWTTLKDDNYRIYSVVDTFLNVKQRWVLVESKHAKARETTKLEKKITEARTAAEKQLKRLKNTEFSCCEDAKKAVKVYEKSLKFNLLQQVSFSRKPVYDKPGRPTASSTPSAYCWQMTGELVTHDKVIDKAFSHQGRFILGTNELDRSRLLDSAVLSEYKGQQSVERGFNFIKDNRFEVSSIFLKKPSRIAALMSIMGLTLLVYKLSEHRLRTSLSSLDASVPNQLGKPTNRPTMRWIFRLFHGIQEVSLSFGAVKQVTLTNVKPVIVSILNHFGPEASAYYGIGMS